MTNYADTLLTGPRSRGQLTDWCLRKLGEPVVEVNVDPDQIDDRITEAISIWTQYHMDGMRRVYKAHQMTAEDIAAEGFEVDDDIIMVVRVLPLGDIHNTGFDMFDLQYQTMFDLVTRGVSGSNIDMAYYEQMQQHLALIDMKLNGTPQFTFSRYRNNIRLYGDIPTNDIKVGDYVVYEGYQILDVAASSTSTEVYNDIWIRDMSTALIKQQWGQNLIKFEGVQMPGGVTVNGRQLYDDATQEVERLMERLRLEFEEPVDFFMG